MYIKFAEICPEITLFIKSNKSNIIQTGLFLFTLKYLFSKLLPREQKGPSHNRIICVQVEYRVEQSIMQIMFEFSFSE